MSKKLIRFDWAVKILLRNKANFIVLEGFLSELLFDAIKIEKILESDGNQETGEDKFNRVDILTQNSKNELVIIEIQNTSDIFPEYYIIKVNQFNDIAKDTLDEWVYFLKNSEVKDEFKAKGLAEAKEVLDIMRLDKEQQYSYNRYLDYLHLKASEALSLQIEAEQKIRKDENLKKAIENARNGISKGYDNKIISDITGLTTQQVEQLRNEKE